MEKQKLADLVMQKMREKKEKEDKNRPHFEVLRLEVVFQQEIHDCLKQDLSALESMLAQQKKSLAQLLAHLQQLDNTGKQNYPRIVIMPDFIASEQVPSAIKEFYRKASNSFLRNDILRSKAFKESVEREKKFFDQMAEVIKLEETLSKKKEAERKQLNDKRVKVLKEDLRLRAIREEQRQVRETIERQREENKQLLKQFELKKLNLQNRKDHLKYVKQQIELYKKKIQQTYNPSAYRQYQQDIFNIEMKTEFMQKNLAEVVQDLDLIEKQTNKYERTLEKTASLTVLGKTKDSPSTRKGKIQKQLQAEKDNRSQYSHRARPSLLSREGSETKVRTLSQHHSARHSVIDLDLSKVGCSTAHQSHRTTDRSSHPRYRSELARQLF